MKYLYETHMHTAPSSACAVSTPAQQVRAYKNRGYAGIIVTDHFVNGNSGCIYGLTWAEQMAFFSQGYEKAKKEGQRCGLDVFLGWEWNLFGTELLTYGLSMDFLLTHPKLDMLSIEQYCKLVREHGGYNAQAHPYRRGYWIHDPYPVDPGLIDGIEVFNATMSDENNKKARAFAAQHNLPMQAGSDSHHENTFFTSGIRLDKKAESIFDIIEAIKTGDAELIVPK